VKNREARSGGGGCDQPPWRTEGKIIPRNTINSAAIFK